MVADAASDPSSGALVQTGPDSPVNYREASLAVASFDPTFSLLGGPADATIVGLPADALAGYVAPAGAVPETSTWVMLIMGFIGLAFMGSRSAWPKSSQAGDATATFDRPLIAHWRHGQRLVSNRTLRTRRWTSHLGGKRTYRVAPGRTQPASPSRWSRPKCPNHFGCLGARAGNVPAGGGGLALLPRGRLRTARVDSETSPLRRPE
jgi:hypothetical protein